MTFTYFYMVLATIIYLQKSAAYFYKSWNHASTDGATGIAKPTACKSSSAA